MIFFGTGFNGKNKLWNLQKDNKRLRNLNAIVTQTEF